MKLAGLSLRLVPYLVMMEFKLSLVGNFQFFGQINLEVSPDVLISVPSPAGSLAKALQEGIFAI